MKNIDVYILAGQSNMAGHSQLKYLDKKYQKEYHNSLIYIGDNADSAVLKKIINVKPGQGYSSECYGPEIPMAYFFESAHKVGFIKYAWGGTAIFQNPDLNCNSNNNDNWHGTWDNKKPGRLYLGLLDTVKEGIKAYKQEGYNPIIKGIVWMQGETDGEIQFNNSKYNASKEYYKNLVNLFDYLRKDIGIIVDSDLTNLPIVFGEIYEYSRAVCNVRDIVLAQKEVGKLSNNYYISTKDLKIDMPVDDWHWNSFEMFTLGYRFAMKLYQLEGLKEYNNCIVKICGYVKDFNNYPVANVNVSIDKKETLTDDSGYFEIDNLINKDYIVNINKKGYLTYQYILVSNNESKNYTLDDIFIHKVSTLKGTITSCGLPVKDAVIICGSSVSKTDHNGCYFIDDICPEELKYRKGWGDTPYEIEVLFIVNGNSIIKYFNFEEENTHYDLNIEVTKCKD